MYDNAVHRAAISLWPSVMPTLKQLRLLASSLLLGLLLMPFIVQASPDIQSWQTSNGARVYYVHAPELPMVDMRVVFDAGAARDAKQPGLALLTNGLLGEGAAGLDADQIANRFESIGAQFGNSAQRDMAALSLRTLSEPKIFAEAVDLFTRIVTRPDFPAGAFAREQARLLASLQQQQQQPDALADQAFYQAVFGNHPYSTQPSGNETSVSALTTEDLKGFYQRYYVARNAVLAIVGDLDRKAAEQLVQQVLGSLPAGQAAEPLPDVMPLRDSNMIHIDYPSAQTHILMGQPGMHRGDPDYFALYVGNHMLGGSGLVARLSNEVREKRGLAYSTYSYFAPMRKDGPFTIGVQTRNESAQETLSVLRETVGRFIKEGPSAEELKASKQNITGGFPLRIASNGNIIDYIAMIGFYNLPLDYLDTFNARVEAVSIDDIKRAFQKRIHLDKMVTVMVGGNQTLANNNNE